MGILGDLAWMCINCAVMLSIAPLIEGYVRKLAARIQGRVGPPLTQPYRDLAKLFARRFTTAPRASSNALYELGPVAVLSATLCACGLIPTVVSRPWELSNFIVVFYLLALSRFLLSAASLNVSNPFAAVSMSREYLLALGAEPSAMLATGVMALCIGSPSLGAMSTLSYAELPRILPPYVTALAAFVMAMALDLALPPFDVAEAEQEICEGVMLEYGGAKLALLKLSLFLKRVASMSLFISVFIPFGISANLSWWTLASALLYVAKLFIIATIVTLVYASSARVRPWSLSRYLLVLTSLSLLSSLIYVLEVR